MFARFQRNGFRKRSWIFFVCFLLILCSTIFAIGICMDQTFEKKIDTDLFSDAGIVRSPRFYIYEFESREGREGRKKEVTDSFFGQKQSDFVPIESVPQALKNAFIAIEDKHFAEHRGVDWKRTFAACVNYFLGFSDSFGASTITQQLIKNVTGNNEVTWKRKLQEIILARDLEKYLDKNEILELYLNVIHFSDNCDGIGMAAAHYFSKEVSELTVAECATIAAITNNPSYYNPIHFPENNLERRNLILLEMKREGYLSDEEYRRAFSEPLTLCVDSTVNNEGVNSWYVDMVIDDVIFDLMEKYQLSRAAATRLFYTKGLTVDMAMDEEIQLFLEEYYRTAVLLPMNPNGERAQSSVIAIDSRTGDILGVVGATGEKKGNRLQSLATGAKRPPGSTLKPLSVYAPALERGLITWGSVYDDVPTDFHFSGKNAWPRNANGVYRGLTDVSYAVAHSTNTVAVRILRELGAKGALKFLDERFDLPNLEADTEIGDAALALGQLSNGVTLREMTAAYTAFADGGIYHAPRSYYRVLDAEGRILLSSGERDVRVLSEGNASVMTKLLEGVVKDGTSGAITLHKSYDCAGKTGTSSNDYDRWFIGYTPDIVCGVWCGYEYPAVLTGRNLSTGIWNHVMQGILERKGGNRSFRISDDVVEVEYCKDSGKLPCAACQLDPRGNRIAKGWFVKGTEPKEECDCHVICRYDSENGGVLHGECDNEASKEISLIRVERHFPIEVYVTDAQYVYREPPSSYPINPNPEQAYFATALSDHCGVSNTKIQYNRSSPLLSDDPWERYRSYFEEWNFDSDPIPIPWYEKEERIPFFE